MAQIDSVSQLPAIILADREKSYYKQLFMAVSKDGFVGLNAAVPFLTKSGLDKGQLGQIWSIVNANGQNSLNPNAFSVALRLVSLAQSGKPISLQQIQATNEFELPRFQDIDLPSTPHMSNFSGISGPTLGGGPSLLGGGGGGGMSSNLLGGTLGPVPSVQIAGSSSFGQNPNDLSASLLLGPYGSGPSTTSPYGSMGSTGGLPPPMSSGSSAIYSSGSGVPASAGYGLGSSNTYGGLLGSASGTPASGAGFSWVITENLKNQYKTHFQSALKVNPLYMSGAEAKEYFGRSGLSDQDLAKIWNLSDRNNDSQLDVDEFALAMFLTQAKRQGQPLPNTLPERLLQSYKTPQSYHGGHGSLGGQGILGSQGSSHAGHGSLGGLGILGSQGSGHGGHGSLGGQGILGSQGNSHGGHGSLGGQGSSQSYAGALALVDTQDPWAITAADKQKYSDYFDKADVARLGKLSGQIVKELFVNFNLANQDLVKIWELSDLNRDGHLDKRGFCIAMHLIDCHRKGMGIPQVLPQSLLDATAYSTSSLYGGQQGQARNTQGYGGGQFSGGNPLAGIYGTGNIFGSNPTAGPAPVLFSTVNELEQQEKRRKEEQERQKTAAIKEQIVNRLNQKTELINKIRVGQQQNIEIAGMLSVQEQQVDRTKKVVKEMESIIDRLKLRITAINDKIQLVQKTANIVREQKRCLDVVINQRQSQFQEEQSRVNSIGQKLIEEKNNRDKLMAEIVKMRNDLANAKNQKLNIEHRIAQIELQRRQEAEEAERRRLAEAAAAEERRLQAEAEERRRQAEAAAAEERRRQLEATAALQKQKEEEEIRLNFERERQEIERKKAEIQNQKKVLEAQLEQGRVRNDPSAPTVDLTANYEKYMDDFGTKVGGVPKGEGALYFGMKHPEFPLGFYPEFQDFGCLVFAFQSPQPPAQAEPTKQAQPVTLPQQVSQPQQSTEESDESSSDDPPPQSFQPPVQPMQSSQPQQTLPVNQSPYQQQSLYGSQPQTNPAIYGNQPPQTNQSQYGSQPSQTNQSQYGSQPSLTNSSLSGSLPTTQTLQSSQPQPTQSTPSAFSDMGFWNGDSTQQVTPNPMEGGGGTGVISTEAFFGNSGGGDILFEFRGAAATKSPNTDDALFSGSNWSSPQTQPSQLPNDPFQGLFAQQPPAADTPTLFSNLFDD